MKAHIGSIIQRKLNEFDLTKADLAKRMKTAYSTVTNWTMAKHLSTGKVIQISEALGYNLFYEIMEDDRLLKLVEQNPQWYGKIYVYNKEEMEDILAEKDRQINALLKEKSEVQAKYIQLIEGRAKSESE